MLRGCRVHTTLPRHGRRSGARLLRGKAWAYADGGIPTGIFYQCGEGTRFVLSSMAAEPAGHARMAFVVNDIAAGSSSSNRTAWSSRNAIRRC